MVLEEARDTGDAILAGSHDATVVDHVCEQELAVAHCEVSQLLVTERPRRLGDPPEHETIPPRQHLVVEPGTHALRTCLAQALAGALESTLDLLDRQPGTRRQVIHVDADVQDVLPLEVAAGRHSPVQRRQLLVLTEQLGEFGMAPDVEPSLLSLAVGIE